MSATSEWIDELEALLDNPPNVDDTDLDSDICVFQEHLRIDIDKLREAIRENANAS